MTCWVRCFWHEDGIGFYLELDSDRYVITFGNDLKDPHLLIASESANSSKSDSEPADWKPTNRAFWCTYAEDYTRVKSV